MKIATFRFYEELNDYLPLPNRKVEFGVEYLDGTSLGDIIESFGVPLDEVDLVLANGRSVIFEYKLNKGDRISVYPVFERFDIKDVTTLSGRPLREPRFITDSNLKELSSRLKELGLDVFFMSFLSYEEIIEKSIREKRTIITMRSKIFLAKNISRMIILESKNLDMQIQQVLESLFIF